MQTKTTLKRALDLLGAIRGAEAMVQRAGDVPGKFMLWLAGMASGLEAKEAEYQRACGLIQGYQAFRDDYESLVVDCRTKGMKVVPMDMINEVTARHRDANAKAEELLAADVQIEVGDLDESDFPAWGGIYPLIKALKALSAAEAA